MKKKKEMCKSFQKRNTECVNFYSKNNKKCEAKSDIVKVSVNLALVLKPPMRILILYIR